MVTKYLIFALILLPGNIYGWFDTGHMVIAHIAYQRLEPSVKNTCDKLLQYIENSFAENASFETIACWADDLKASVEAFNQWHFSNKPFDPQDVLTDQQKEDIKSSDDVHNVVWSIHQCINSLKRNDMTNAPPFLVTWGQGMMLAFLIHFVGDCHQPLHCVDYFNNGDFDYPEGDNGGVRFAIDHPQKNLHFLWDSILGLGDERLQRPLTDHGQAVIEKLTSLITTLFPEDSLPEALNLDPQTWHDESFQQAQQFCYAGIQPSTKPTASYLQQGQTIACKRLALAGYRLAHLLNTIFKND